MVNLLLKVGVNALAIWIAVQFVGGLNYDSASEGWLNLVLIAIVLGLVNGLVKPIARFFSFPAILLTLGLFLLVINIAMFAIVLALAGPGALDLGLTNDGGFGAVAVGGFIVSLVVWVGELVLGDD